MAGEELLLDALQPIVDLVQPALLKLSVLVGGIFGLYLLLLFFRVHYERKKVRILQDIRYDLDKLNIHFDISTSKQRKTRFKRIVDFFRFPSRK
ncbi:hypothetical protein HOI26_03495 [Candidatus Woesearchaeota archaeon]|jgi:hypothetical protein|nr:hypothetical protein [Candidatus Woesearchaeota archaeon]MBT5740140.1 hypothetical protein [Candidatus Woesearchaeota archaeon]